MRAFIKNYVLTLLFLKYVSDKHKQGGGMIELPAGTTFDDIVKLKNTADIGDRLNKIIAQIAEANDLKGVIDVTDFNDEDKLGKGKEMIDRLSRLVGIFKKLNLSSNQAEDDDLLGDAYEYLMRHFATESGKSKGQRPLQNSFPSRQPKSKHRFSAVFGCFRPRYLLILPKRPLNPARIPDNQASGLPFRRQRAHLACWRLSTGSNTSPS
ncbi:type I restriction-modification system subunit M N-terminal domain-containing protein, partial [Neisseria meningitidis]|uniref:type I restriction-modification system subunit M N-terminal domain-containing protein n=1 Tax=Neisseria meningitidis TaxID=487 RepID=UPI002434955E